MNAKQESTTFNMTCYMTSDGLIKANLETTKLFKTNGIVTSESNKDAYNESYEVSSSVAEDLVLNTKNKIMYDNIVVKKTPVSETSNEAGGYTLYIG